MNLIMEIVFGYGVFVVLSGAFIGAVLLTYHVGARPYRWLSQSRYFINALDMADRRRIPYEQALIKLADYGERNLGLHFHVLAEWLRSGLKLHEALPLAPKLLPQPIQTLVVFGSEKGLLTKLIPFAQRSLQELTDRSANKRNEIFGLLTISVALFGVIGMLSYLVLPKFEAIVADMLPHHTVLLNHLYAHRNWFLFGHAFVITLMAVGFFFMIGGSANHAYTANRLPRLSDLASRFFPWQRIRQEQRFGRMLATLLDEKVPEDVALKVAVAFAASPRFQKRVDACLADLRAGKGLIESLRHVGLGGDFKFRMRAAHESGRPFAEALNDWFDALHVRAQKHERAVTEAGSTCFTIYNAAIVGLVTYAFFDFEVFLINRLSAW